MLSLREHLTSTLRFILPKSIYKKIKSSIIPPHYIVFSGGWKGAVKFNEDGLATAHNADFINEPNFIRAYKAGTDTESWGPKDRSPIRWRVFIACSLSKYAARIPGDFVECGTNRGGTAMAIINFFDFKNTSKKFYLLDTFQGFDESLLTSKERELLFDGYNSRYKDCFEEVRSNFEKYPFCEIIKGSVPGTLSQVQSKEISFLHLDMNCSEPEIEALKFFWDKLSPGGVVLLDDYGWDEHLDQKIAMDSFAKSKSLEVISLPTGQGLIMKPYW